MGHLFRWIGISLLLSLALPAQGQETQRQAYFAFDPDITTNFVKVGDSRRLGYLRVSIEAVTRSVEDLGLVEHHSPLLRDAFIQVFGQAQEGKVRSLTGREELRQECLERAQELLRRETGREVVKDIIFTTYLYQ
ncbi:flagellar basal body-associated FliL family protein [Aliidiomarina sp. Khilg15.8]